METYKKRYQLLNDEQRAAVDQIEGPVLVLAGPGTGKTELLSVRVARILNQTDTLPTSILCLTFTEAAAYNMRERLRSVIGDDAYSVQINTYHSFSSDIIKSYPEFFETINLETGEDSRLERPIDELRQYEIVRKIIEALPFSDPLRSARHYVKSVLSTISDCKQAALTPEQVRIIGQENLQATKELSPSIQNIFSTHKRMPSKLTVALELFQSIVTNLERSTYSLAEEATSKLNQALLIAEESQSTKPLTAWKNSWLKKDDSDNWLFGDILQSEKLISFSNIYEKYQLELTTAGQYDFNDMILRTIDALEQKPELRYNLQEKYQYILLDEFQDTNAAQFKLIRLLADHPVHEGRPNIMAVGDDDQGIFAFQGADIGNMVAFLDGFRDVSVINLVKNYRSHHDILHIAHGLGDQIESRLHHNLKNVSKTIIAASDSLPKRAKIARHEFASQANEYGWIAETIKKLITEGVPPKEIAVLAPKHTILEDLVPFLNAQSIPVSYEKRENIFDTEIIQALLLMSEFILAANDQSIELMDSLLPNILSMPFWNIPTQEIWKLNWKFHELKFKEYTPWPKLALENSITAPPTQFLLQLALQANDTPLEYVLDYMVGAKPLTLDGEIEYFSPLKQYYFAETVQETSPLAFYEAISYLSVIRSHIRDLQQGAEQVLRISDFVGLYRTYNEAEQGLINTHPVTQDEAAVHMQTVYKAKGLEYRYVFLPCMQDDVWGSTVLGMSSKLSLPENLKHIRNDTSSEDTRRRLLFVAVTRAKEGLYLTSYDQKESGKKTMPVKYLHETEQDGEKLSTILPKSVQAIHIQDRDKTVSQHDIETLWFGRADVIDSELKSLVSQHLASYRMSPTHLNTFTNLEYAGPQNFLIHTLLRFPEAPSPDSIYGDALHKTLEWLQTAGKDEKDVVELSVNRFTERIRRSHMNTPDQKAYIDRGARSLRIFLAKNVERLQSTEAEVEMDFRKEGIMLGNALLTGKIDRLEVDHKAKTVRIIDFKSGAPSSKWSSSAKYINYKQQLYFYCLLIKKSRRFKNYRIESAALEFIEPMSNGSLAEPLELRFNEGEYEQFKLLVESVWKKIQDLDLPNVDSYPKTPVGIRAFIQDLIKQ